VEKHRRDFERAPLDLGNIAFDVDVPQDVKFSYIRKMDARVVVWVPNGGRKPWRLWVPLIGGRPNQLTRYVFGVDISAGSGASNSVITVLDHSTGMIVAKFWDAFTSPEELAEIVSFAGIWFGGTKSPLVVFEKNGPGIIFGKKLLTLGYPTIYYQKVDGLKRAGDPPLGLGVVAGPQRDAPRDVPRGTQAGLSHQPLQGSSR
jgi:hypothetical protein